MLAGKVIEVWAAVTGITATLFFGLDNALRPKKREEIWRWLNGTGNQTWIDHFTTLFETIFGSRHWTWHCFRRSSVASLVVVIGLLLLWARTRTHEVWAAVTSGPATLALIVTAVVFAIPVDFMSLYKTRRLITAARTRGQQFGVLMLIDVALTVCVIALALVYLLVGYIPVFLSWGNAVDTFHTLVSQEGVRSTLALRSFKGYGWYPHGVFFYSLFFPSIWLWLYGFGALALSRVKWLRDLMKEWLDLGTHPVRGIGVMIMAAEAVFFAAMLFLSVALPQ